ncbi:type II secretion system protein F, partial [Nocardioides hankookensis]
MGALVGLGVGIGLLLVWSAFVLPRRPRDAAPTSRRTSDLLARAGLGQVSVAGFVVLCLVCGLATTLVMQVVSGTPPVALAFGLMGGYLPVAV